MDKGKTTNAECDAFPSTDGASFANNGLTKREYIASMAMQGLALHAGATPEGIAIYAVKLADELLRQLEK